MLTLRASQRQTLQALRREAFVACTAAHAESLSSHRGARRSRAAFEALTRDAISMAERHGIESEYDIRRFVECFFDHGGSVQAIESHRWITEILRRPGVPGRTKMDLIDDLELERLRATK